MNHLALGIFTANDAAKIFGNDHLLLKEAAGKVLRELLVAKAGGDIIQRALFAPGLRLANNAFRTMENLADGRPLIKNTDLRATFQELDQWLRAQNNPKLDEAANSLAEALKSTPDFFTRLDKYKEIFGAAGAHSSAAVSSSTSRSGHSR